MTVANGHTFLAAILFSQWATHNYLSSSPAASPIPFLLLFSFPAFLLYTHWRPYPVSSHLSCNFSLYCIRPRLPLSHSIHQVHTCYLLQMRSQSMVLFSFFNLHTAYILTLSYRATAGELPSYMVCKPIQGPREGMRTVLMSV